MASTGSGAPNISQDFPDDVRERGLVRGDESCWEMQVMREGREMSSGRVVCVVIPEHQMISPAIMVAVLHDKARRRAKHELFEVELRPIRKAEGSFDDGRVGRPLVNCQDFRGEKRGGG